MFENYKIEYLFKGERHSHESIIYATSEIITDIAHNMIHKLNLNVLIVTNETNEIIFKFLSGEMAAMIHSR